MKKKLLFFILFLGTLLAHGQTEYGILIKSTINPRSKWPPDDNEGVHSISVGTNGCSIDLYGRTDKVPKYCFFYVTDKPTELFFSESMGASQICGSIRRQTAYDKDTFSAWYFSGCLANSEIMAIHIPELSKVETNEKCIDEVLTLKNGWNWRYKLGNDDWRNFPSQFQEKTSVSFKIKDLPGYTSQTQVHFQAGYGTQYTNIRTYSIIGCSPELEEKKPSTTKVKCLDESNGSATLKFKTTLKDKQQFLFNLYKYNTDLKDFFFMISEFASEKATENKTFTWYNLAKGTYLIKYQAQSVDDKYDRTGSSAIITDPFTVENATPLTFTAKDLQPKCSTDKGGILISAFGGTPPYYYIFNNQTKTVLPTNPYTIENLADGVHSVIVLDSNNCIEQ